MTDNEIDWEARARHAAAEDNDPEMLIGPDVIRYAEALIREDHRVISPDFQFWGAIADYLNDIASLPDRPGAQTPNWATRFNLAVSTAVGYIRMSGATAETKTRLLRYFPPPPKTTAGQEQGDRAVDGHRALLAEVERSRARQNREGR